MVFPRYLFLRRTRLCCGGSRMCQLRHDHSEHSVFIQQTVKEGAPGTTGYKRKSRVGGWLPRQIPLFTYCKPPQAVAILSGVIDADARGCRVIRCFSRVRNPQPIRHGRLRERYTVPRAGDPHYAAHLAGPVCHLFSGRRCRLFRTGIRTPVGIEQRKIVARQDRTDQYRLRIVPLGSSYVQARVQTVNAIYIHVSAGEIHRFGTRRSPSAIRVRGAIRHAAVRLGFRNDSGKRTGRRFRPQPFSEEGYRQGNCICRGNCICLIESA